MFFSLGVNILKCCDVVVLNVEAEERWHADPMNQCPVPLAFRLVTWIFLVRHTLLQPYLLWANCHWPGNLMALRWLTHQGSSHHEALSRALWTTYYFVTSSSNDLARFLFFLLYVDKVNYIFKAHVYCWKWIVVKHKETLMKKQENYVNLLSLYIFIIRILIGCLLKSTTYEANYFLCIFSINP